MFIVGGVRVFSKTFIFL